MSNFTKVENFPLETKRLISHEYISISRKLEKLFNLIGERRGKLREASEKEERICIFALIKRAILILILIDKRYFSSLFREIFIYQEADRNLPFHI